LRLIMLALWFYAIAILVYVVLSWVGQRHGSPVASLLADIVEPVLRPVRRILPPIAGLDLSPLLVLIALQAGIIARPLHPALRQPRRGATGAPPGHGMVYIGVATKRGAGNGSIRFETCLDPPLRPARGLPAGERRRSDEHAGRRPAGHRK